MVTFYKGVLCTDLRSTYIPGTVTTCFKEAMQWYERISGNKRKGAARHVKHGKAAIISINYDERTLQECDEFQKAGVQEHSRANCWTSLAKTKAQINTPVQYRVLSDDEIWNLFSSERTFSMKESIKKRIVTEMAMKLDEVIENGKFELNKLTANGQSFLYGSDAYTQKALHEINDLVVLEFFDEFYKLDRVLAAMLKFTSNNKYQIIEVFGNATVGTITTPSGTINITKLKFI